MILALSVHEFAHAFVAYKLGDDTAARMGRLTLNPVSHIDPIGTLLIPIVGLSANIPFIGWAKPVPFSPVQLTRRLSMKTGSLLVAAAGPASNLLFALLVAGLLAAIGPSALPDITAGTRNAHVAIVQLCCWTFAINIGLFMFNLLPVPPLDGSKVLAGLLPDKYAYILEFISRYSFVLFILIFFVAGSIIFVPMQAIILGIGDLIDFPIWYVLWSGA